MVEVIVAGRKDKFRSCIPTSKSLFVLVGFKWNVLPVNITCSISTTERKIGRFKGASARASSAPHSDSDD